MKKTIEICTCDLCGLEDKIKKDVRTLVYRTFDSTDGRTFYNEPYFEEAKLDLCLNCLKQIVLIHGIGVQCEKYEINKSKFQ